MIIQILWNWSLIQSIFRIPVTKTFIFSNFSRICLKLKINKFKGNYLCKKDKTILKNIFLEVSENNGKYSNIIL
jgi:hypothetical protein